MHITDHLQKEKETRLDTIRRSLLNVPLILFFVVVVVEEVVCFFDGIVQVSDRVDRISHVADDLFGFVEPQWLVIVVDEAHGVEHPWEEESGGGSLPVGLHGADDLDTLRDGEPLSVDGKGQVAPEFDDLRNVTRGSDPSPSERQSGQRVGE